jgi:hypothetical protein
MNVVNRFIDYTNRSGGVIRVLTRAFHRFRGVATEASAAFWADEGRESFRFHRRESVNDDLFDPVRMVTRTAAIPVPIAGTCEWFVRLQFPRLVVHRATPQTIRTL